MLPDVTSPLSDALRRRRVAVVGAAGLITGILPVSPYNPASGVYVSYFGNVSSIWPDIDYFAVYMLLRLIIML